MEPGADAVDDDGRGYGESWRTTTRAEEVDDVVMRDSDGEGRSIAPTVDIAAKEGDFSGAVEDVLDSMPRRRCEKPPGRTLSSNRKRRRRQ